ncbi:MAG TPA: hypothetical protein DDX51_01650 [Clostridiales bacterium]|nr:hypothetical protein [Clostridiales bacterium]
MQFYRAGRCSGWSSGFFSSAHRIPLSPAHKKTGLPIVRQPGAETVSLYGMSEKCQMSGDDHRFPSV